MPKQVLSDMALFFLMLALIVSLLFLVDPSQRYWGFYESKVVKYFPIELGMMSMVFYILAGLTRAPKRMLLFLLFGVWVLFGGIYTVLIIGNPLKESFVGRGLVIFLIYPAYCMAKSDRQLRFFLKVMIPVFMIAAFFIFLGLLVWTAGIHFIQAPHIFHTQVILPVSAGLGILLFYRSKNPLLAYGAGLLLLSSGILLFKNTGFLVVLIALLLFISINWSSQNTLNKQLIVLRRGAIVLVTFFMGVAIVILVSQMDWASIYSFMPSGSPAVRLKTYIDRFEMFLENPFFGMFFTGSPILVLPTKNGDLEIPSHSDLLDVLGFGGLFGFFLFFTPILYVLRKLYGNLKRLAQVPYAPLFLWAYTYTLMGLLVLTVNPIWSQPEAFVLFMLSLGVLFAYVERVEEKLFC